jgi:tetratricopeptide (TPR) repeat protein
MPSIKLPVHSSLLFALFFLFSFGTFAQALRIPGTANISCSAGRKVGTTEINIHWNAPGVKGREGKIWGTDIAYFGTTVLGFGSDVPSPWRAGADECTTMSFSTDVMINGQSLKAGKYAFFIELGKDESTLIFNSNIQAWGTYFYDISKDVLRVSTKQQKDQKNMKERLEYTFTNQTPKNVEVALEWESWRIPFTVEVDLKATLLADIQAQMSGALGFDPPSMIAAANWCLQQDINLDQALGWINSATNPNLGGINSFQALSVKSGILKKKGKNEESDLIMKQAIDNANTMELHQYGRQLLNEKKVNEAMTVFEKNYIKNKGAWPTNVGMMRAHSALGNIKKALEFAREALKQAPDDINKKNLENAIKTLESGKAL